MENFVVSARKYRPTTFETVVGQSHITTTLKNAIKNKHLAQAFLFCGPRGVGKTTNARILAKTINCENITSEIEACNECESCKSFNNNASFNVHELDAASNNSVDDIRNLVDQVRYPPQYGKYKIYIIDEVHMLSNAAFNAFLKTLEEPPKYAIFILATTEKHKIIPTILSRCQIFDFSRISVKDIASHLERIAEKESIKAEAQALHLIAQKADGALRDALSLFDLIVTFSSDNTVTYKCTIDNLHILDYDYYFKMTDLLNRQDVSGALLVYDEILRDGFDGHNFIIGLGEHLRNLLVCKDAATLKLLEVSDEVKQKYGSQAEATSISFLMSCLNIISGCDLQYKNSKNPRLLIELALMKMAFLNQAINLGAELRAMPEELKKKADTVNNIGSGAPAEAPSESKSNIGPAAPKPVAAEKSELKSTIKLPSLKDLQKGADTKVPEKKTETVSASDLITVNKPIDPKDLMKYWQEYAMMLRNEGKMNEYFIIDRAYDLVDGNIIKIKLDNFIQQDQINEMRSSLLDFLRSKISNKTLQLEAELSSQDEVKLIYTPKEKLNYLTQKYPIIDELRKRFGLESEF